MDQYVEGNYYEYLRDRRKTYLVLRFIKREEGNNLFYDLTNKKEVKIFVDELFWELSVFMCRGLELQSRHNDKLIFEDLFDEIRVKYSETLQLEEEEKTYSLSKRFLDEEKKFAVCNNINDFFKQLDEKFQIKLTIEEKDDFISKQFAK